MAEVGKLRFVVSFLRPENEMSDVNLQEALEPVTLFFERRCRSSLIASCDLTECKRRRCGGRGVRTREQGNGLLYEAPFAEAIYTISFEEGTEERRKVSFLNDLYRAWCESPPSLEAWLSRGVDQHIFSGPIQRTLERKLPVEELSFGVVIGLTTFCPEVIIDKRRSSVIIKALFDHVHKKLELSLVLEHTCEAHENEETEFIMRISYYSIARAIVNLNEDYDDLYFRLTHPAILKKSAKKSTDSKSRYRQVFDRVNVLGCSAPNCALKVGSRRLGGSNTIKLRMRRDRETIEILHTLFSKLQRSENVIGAMRTIPKPKEGIPQVRRCLEAFFNDAEVSFRAKYAVEACKLISFDLTRQLAVLPVAEVKEFISELKKRASHEGTYKLFERTMFHLLRAIDEGNVVIFRSALPSQFKKFQVQERERRHHHALVGDKEKLLQGSAIIYKVFLTPSRTILRPPEEHGDNRILRLVGTDYMLRLAFRDDDLRSLSNSLSGCRGHELLDCFLKEFLREGIYLADRKYDYLAASSSQLRDHGCWFYAKDDKGHSAESIRQQMGFFDKIENVGKKMAREGLCFSSTIETVPVTLEECSIEPDIQGGAHDISKEPYTFSDGIGKISGKLRDDVCAALADSLKGRKPSAFQIRYRGAKGMVAFDPNLEGRRLVLRKSMVKFDCPQNTISSFEVIKYSEERSTTLNKQIITLLEQLGVPSHVFLKYQEMNIREFTDALIFESEACARLRASLKTDPDCPIDFSKFRDFGMSVIRDPYFRSALIALFRNILNNLRSKARIAIPWDLGRNLLGVLDETGTLEYGQVYIRYTVKEDEEVLDEVRDASIQESAAEGGDTDITEPLTKVVTGKVVVTKCPCVHPGDIRMLNAVDKPGLEHLVDVIVFPQKGPRPHPNEMAGSDLDGDEYAVFWDPQLFFECKCNECQEDPRPDGNHKPMVFDDSPAEKKANISLEDYYEFICNFIMTDNKGRISNAHLAFSDSEERGIFSPKCLRLAEKLSTCLDFAKTGRMTEILRDERVKSYPDFMEKQDHKPTYSSKKVLGQLYRASRSLENTVSTSSMNCGGKYVNEFFKLDGWEKMKTQAITFVRLYEERLTKILNNMGIKSEAEFMVSLVNDVGKYQSDTFHEIEQLQEQLERQRSYLNKRMKEDFHTLAEGDHDNELLLASACYTIVYDPPQNESYTHFYGAPWILSGTLINCARLKEDFFRPIPNCPIASQLDEIIKKKQYEGSNNEERTMWILKKWSEAEGLMNQNKSVSICVRCLHKIFRASDQTIEAVEIEAGVGANVVCFLRYCANRLSYEIRDMVFSDCKSECAMYRKDISFVQRVAMTAMATYSSLAVSGDLCAIKGLSCGETHTLRENWTAKLCSPLVPNINRMDSKTFLKRHRLEVVEILKEWCNAEEDDQIFIKCDYSSDNPRVEIIIEAKPWVRHALEERLFRDEEEILIQDLKDEIQKRSRNSRSTFRWR